MASAQNNWLPETEELYTRLRALAERGGWVQIWNTKINLMPPQYAFSSVITENGRVLHHALFVQEEEKSLMGVCQFGEEAQGLVGVAHGGATATMHDGTTGVLADRVLGKAIVTASLAVNFKRPTPLRSPILIVAHVDKIEGKKVFLKSYMKSPDGATVYSDCTVLYVNIESKLKKKANSRL
ncbi:acyl-coenzyme A thioesterase THEM4-like [Acanthaster planci]|uniref:Acyl-coenzyme A thioesterase THEM4 n=1 Tax=Acanthaster planci TaxID=133434 RepID=A0A8B8A2L0_ACAPL|nr:acyl-coenzyme A thioesterase THEM4-like [Acanthaster planci]